MLNIINFTKMHGLGNDFVVVDAINQPVFFKKTFNKSFITDLGNRHTGVGFDQLLLIEKSIHIDADFFCRIFNSDGSEAEQCGNGMRCVGRFIHEKKLSSKKNLSIETKSGIVEVILHDVDHFETIQVNMGKPEITASCEFKLSLTQVPILLSIISMGNPHVVLEVESIKNTPVQKWGAEISTHPIFPQGTNVGFMEIVSREHIRLRTFERGAGETCACGTNACAAVVAGIQKKLLDHKVRVELALGSLWIEWAGKDAPVMMTGPAEKVFEGTIEFK